MTLPHDCDRRIAKLFQHWESLRPAPGTLPGRRHVEPAALLDLLPHVWMCDVEKNPLRFRYRLVGTSVTMTMEREVTGAWLDEVHDGFVASDAYADFVAAADGAPSYYRGTPLFHLDKEHVAIERILLPLAEDSLHVDMLLGLTAYKAAHLAA